MLLIIILLFSSNQTYLYKSLEPSKYPIIEGLEATEYNQSGNNLLIDAPIKLKSNWAVTFTVKLNRGNNNYWQQMLGVSPFRTYEGRIFGAWLCPWANTIHFRTATKGLNGYMNWNDAILGELDCVQQIPINQRIRFDVVSNDNGNGTQTVVTYMQNISAGESKPRQIKYNVMNSEYFSPKNGFYEGYIFTSYQGYYNNNIIDGTVEHVGFATGDTPMDIINLDRDRNYGTAASSDRKSNFTTMSDAIHEGYANIGGLGNNGGIPFLTPPTGANSTISQSAIRDPTNYNAITNEKGNKVCERSVVQENDPQKSLDLIKNTGYNYPVQKGSDSYPGSGKNNPGTVPICSPDDLYIIQNSILKRINDFNSEYSDYMTYLYNKKHNIPGDTTPKLTYKGAAKDANGNVINGRYNDTTAAQNFNIYSSVTSLPAYTNLMTDLQTYNNLLMANKAYYPDPENTPTNPRSDIDPLSKADPLNLYKKHSEIMNFRNDLDKKLFELNNIQNSAEGESQLQRDSSIYVNILWTTLATCVIYFIFV